MSRPLHYVEMTHDELGEELNLTRSTISEIEQRAIAKFKRELARRGINLEDLLESKPNEK